MFRWKDFKGKNEDQETNFQWPWP